MSYQHSELKDLMCSYLLKLTLGSIAHVRVVIASDPPRADSSEAIFKLLLLTNLRIASSHQVGIRNDSLRNIKVHSISK
jgi:hypothetical protein